MRLIPTIHGKLASAFKTETGALTLVFLSKHGVEVCDDTRCSTFISFIYWQYTICYLFRNKVRNLCNDIRSLKNCAVIYLGNAAVE